VAHEAAEYTGQSDRTAGWDCPETRRALCMNTQPNVLRFIIFEFYLIEPMAKNEVLPLNPKFDIPNAELDESPPD
jgi:hypothetical protein